MLCTNLLLWIKKTDPSEDAPLKSETGASSVKNSVIQRIMIMNEFSGLRETDVIES